MPRSSTLRPRQVANRTRNPWRTPVPRRPRDLLAKSAEVAREPTTLAELFTSALLNQDGLGCPGDGTESNDVYDDVRIDLYIERKEGAVEGPFQDDPSFKLILRLEPVLFMRILTVELDEFVGDASAHHAPLWIKELAIGKERSLHVVRTYVWLSAFLEHALSTPRQQDSNPQQWDEFAKYVSRIKTDRELMKIMRAAAARTDRSRTPPRPRPVWRMLRNLTDALEDLAVTEENGDVEKLRRRLERTSIY